MKITKHIYAVLCLLLLVLASSSCVDDFGREEFIPEGESEISVTLGFKSFTPALENRRSAGDAIKAINSLWVVVYSVDGNLIGKYPINDFTVHDIRPNDRPDGAADAEEQTGHVEFKMKINNGQYKIYAVANHDLSDENIAREENLKSLPLTWNSEDVTRNAQMFGWFTQDEDMPHEDYTFNAPVVTIKASGSIRAWVVRAASKLTIVYDGSGLNEGVYVYIKKAQIKDIPLTCPLGAANHPGLEGDITQNTKLIDGEILPYYEGDTEPDDAIFENNTIYKNCVTRDGGILGSHSETAESLYFYENLQPDGTEGTVSDKRQDVSGNNKQVSFPNGDNPDNEAWKDARPYGTYVEVTGFYVSRNENEVSSGPIVYRFMLGKNVTTDYCAERNHHYKLTMKFHGQANDFDWHIKYREQNLDATQPKVFNYQGKVFMPDASVPNLGHTFINDNEIIVTSYEENKGNMTDKDTRPLDIKVSYRPEGATEFSSTCDWLTYETAPGDSPSETRFLFKIPSAAIKYTTVDIDEKLKNAEERPMVDLANPDGSGLSTANCYMVDAPGWYKLPLVYGNALHKGVPNEESFKTNLSGSYVVTHLKNHAGEDITQPYLKDNGCLPASASLVWQDEDELVSKIEYLPDDYGGKGGIKFYVSRTTIQQGNAVIAIKDKNGTVMWSWHIWVTRFDFDDEDKTIGVRGNGWGYKPEYKVMPVNLGWCSDHNEKIRYFKKRKCEVKFTSGGLSVVREIVQESHIAFPCGNSPYYQWGRKDPFIGRRDGNGNNKLRYYAPGQYYWEDPFRLFEDLSLNKDRKNTRECLQEGLLIQNPDKWHNPPRYPDNNDVETYLSRNMTYYNLWGEDSDFDSPTWIKTVYDPCPAGYQVGHYDLFGFATTTRDVIWNISPGFTEKDYWYDVHTENIMTGNPTANLYEFYTSPDKTKTIIFPEIGYRDFNARAGVIGYGNVGYSWSCKIVPGQVGTGLIQADVSNSDDAYNFEYGRTYGVRPTNRFYTCDGFPVRPWLNESN